jgi:hypothetical protein
MTDEKLETDTFKDLTERFVFHGDSLEYHDGPIAGWVTRRADGQVFAFSCTPIVPDALWHWSLFYVSRIGESAVQEERQERWVSIVEDRRTGDARCALVEIRQQLP